MSLGSASLGRCAPPNRSAFRHPCPRARCLEFSQTSTNTHPHIPLASRRPRAYKRILPRAARLGRMAQGMPNRPMEFRLISL
ncbi:protein of unknown function [Azospirillum lipoferum 4B]|uniref:Uncharacterized protein n=1 Tax=Azospirillum lipoferum (strain 4B) TaxID=862719 RepID=G7Z2E1_AZOL4|nr:protein of unknown function [Azospirillum lipoferum 4B]